MSKPIVHGLCGSALGCPTRYFRRCPSTASTWTYYTVPSMHAGQRVHLLCNSLPAMGTCHMFTEKPRPCSNAGKLTAAKQAAGWEPKWRSGCCTVQSVPLVKRPSALKQPRAWLELSKQTHLST